MKTHIAFLRGINVSGQNKVPMSELRDLLSRQGFQNVQTYIQSGNIIFESNSHDKMVMESQIYDAIKHHFGFEVSILVKTQGELKTIFDACPFSEEKKINSYFMLLYSMPEPSLINRLREMSYPKEEFYITGSCVYFYSQNGYGKAKCNNNFFERKLKVVATARNYKTITKLLSLFAD